MEVTCVLKEQSNPSKCNIEIKSNYWEKDFANIVINDETYIVRIDEIISALQKVKLDILGE